MEKACSKIAKILRAGEERICDLEKKLSGITRKDEGMKDIVEENSGEIQKSLNILGVSAEASAGEINDALISKIEADDNLLFEALKRPLLATVDGCNSILEAARKIVNSQKSFFLKIDKAKELLEKNPPPKVIKVFGYNNIKELLNRENIFEVFSSLRFIEGNEWLNKIFLPEYKNLKPSDFEEREIKTLTINPKIVAAATEDEDFIKKKYHNISHLKELGVIFIIPVSLGVSGELIRNFSLLLHYFHEVSFYADIFRNLREENFSSGLVSLLQGQVIEEKLNPSERSQWLIIQRYLAKDDENDWRLFEPHINPEAIHWEKAENSLVKAGELLDGFSLELSFWGNLNWVGDYFKTDSSSLSGNDVLVSFNLVDTAMSLVKEKEMIKYLYHHQEALWNKIFSEYFGEDKMEKAIKENIARGWFTI